MGLGRKALHILSLHSGFKKLMIYTRKEPNTGGIPGEAAVCLRERKVNMKGGVGTSTHLIKSKKAARAYRKSGNRNRLRMEREHKVAAINNPVNFPFGVVVVPPKNLPT